MGKVYNFSAGPAVLPSSVLERAKAELLDWHGSGMSVMEMSHRGPEFMRIIAEAEADLRELLAIPENYRVLFLQGGATLQFAAVPMNLLRGKGKAAYVNTGAWSKKAITEAKKYCEVEIAASSEDRNFTYVPPQDRWQISADAAYAHVCTNETIGGVEFDFTPDTGALPLVADMSSHILSKPVDVSHYGLIYAGAQKNVGPAGLAIVIVREDLLGHAAPDTPTLMDYAVQAKDGSMHNTPPTFAIYVAGLVFQWLKAQGGLAGMAEINRRKAALLYDAIDGSDFYRSPVEGRNRSLMNVPFTLKDPAHDEGFLKGAKERGLIQLKGHRSVGGMRASIYNAMPEEGVRALVSWMDEFARTHG